MENLTFVPRARYLRLLRRRRRYELLYHSMLRLCSEFRESRSFLWLNIKKSIHGKSSRIKKCGEVRHVPDCLVYILEYPDFGCQGASHQARRAMRQRCTHIFRVCLRQCAKGPSWIRACPRRIVIFESLKNRHMLAEITQHRTGTGVVHTQTSFSEDLWSLFSRDF